MRQAVKSLMLVDEHKQQVRGQHRDQLGGMQRDVAVTIAEFRAPSSCVHLDNCASKSIAQSEFMQLVSKVYVFTSPFPHRGAKYCDERVCMSVCPLAWAYLKNHTSKRREIFCT